MMDSVDSLATSRTLLRLVAIPGNEDAWRTFFNRYYDFVWNQCRHCGLQRHDATEVSALVFEGLLSALPRFQYDPALRFRGYLSRAIMNGVRKLRRGQGSRPLLVDPQELDLRECMDRLTSLATDLDDRILTDLRLLDRAFEKVRRSVAPRTWQAFRLTAIDGRRGDEAAAHLGMTVAAVYVAKSRVAARVRAVAAELHR